MDDHFRAFSFVDRITLVESGVRFHGRFTVPLGIDTFPHSLAAEAVGQLAAWGAMAAVNFSHRPLAGIAGEVEMLAPVRPGQQLELVAELESVDTDSVVYSGVVQVDGMPVIRLKDCVGPMVPLDQYDEPAAVRERFNLICGTGAHPGGFDGVPDLALERTSETIGESLQATLAVPQTAAFFADHFPRRAVFPGTLLLHANLRLARRLIDQFPRETNGTTWTIRKLLAVKLRAFISPGTQLQLEVRAVDRSDNQLLLEAKTRSGQRTICNAEVVLGNSTPS